MTGTKARLEFTDRGLRLHGELSHEEWVALGMELSRRRRTNAWYLGDWWNAHKKALEPEELIGILEALELDLKTVRNLASICAAYPLEERWPELTISHHRAAVALPPEVRREFLRQAAEEGLSLRELEARIQAWKKREARKRKAEEKAGEEPVGREKSGGPWEVSDLEGEEEPLETSPQRKEPTSSAGTPSLTLPGLEVVVEGNAVECQGYPESRVKIGGDGKIFLWYPSARLTPPAARALAQALLVAADLVEKRREEVGEVVL